MVKIPSAVVLPITFLKILFSLVYRKFHVSLYNLCLSQAILIIFHCSMWKSPRILWRTFPSKLISLLVKSKLVSKLFCLCFLIVVFYLFWCFGFFLNTKGKIFLCLPGPFKIQQTISWPGLPIKAAALISNIFFSRWKRFLANVLPEISNNDYGH